VIFIDVDLNVFGILGLRIAVENALVADSERDSLDVYG
jgi:hypothetical protein